MKHLFLASLSVLVLASGSPAVAQTIATSTPQLNFGTATEVAPQTRTVVVNNPTADPISVQARFFGVYGQPAWSASPAQFTVAAGGQQTVTVTFAPLHNIQHNSELVFETTTRGAVSVDLVGQGQYSKTYYNSTQNLREQALLLNLKSITTAGHNALGYNTGRDRMFMVIDNKKVNGQGASVNTVECVYTGRQATNYTSRSGAQSQNFNTEHTWPQSLFNSADPMVSDLNHLFPTDDAANGSRGNQAFGVATMPYVNDNVNAPSHLGANGRYEPRNPQKGRTARAMIYFVTRYQNYSSFFTSHQSTLRQWAKQFPVNQVDRKRNDDVFAAQGNRNPYVDYPQLLDRISNIVGNPSVAPDSVSVYRSASSINFGTLAGTATYSFVLVNNGTQPLVISNPVTAAVTTGAPATASANLVVGTPGGSVAPGESVRIELTLDPNGVTGAITGELNVGISLPAGPLVVPFTANGSVTAAPRELEANVSLAVYPNPATEELTVVRHLRNPSLTATGAYQVAVLDGLGRVVRHLTTADELSVMDLRGLTPGLYVVRAGGLSQRVVIN